MEGHLTLFTLTSMFHIWFPHGRGQIDPPPLYFVIVIQVYNIWYVFGKLLSSTSLICNKKMAILQKFKYFLRNLVIKQKNCNIIYIFEKPLAQQIQMLKISKT